jgi:hypothetical protein
MEAQNIDYKTKIIMLIYKYLENLEDADVIQIMQVHDTSQTYL